MHNLTIILHYLAFQLKLNLLTILIISIRYRLSFIITSIKIKHLTEPDSASFPVLDNSLLTGGDLSWIYF